MNTCKTCKHFDPDVSKYLSDNWVGVVGICLHSRVAICAENPDIGSGKDDYLVDTARGEIYVARDFGCIHHERK